MAKSKNHTNQNQNKKAHRNGIKRAAKRRPSLSGVDPKFVRNLRYAKKKNWQIVYKVRKMRERISKGLPCRMFKELLPPWKTCGRPCLPWEKPHIIKRHNDKPMFRKSPYPVDPKTGRVIRPKKEAASKPAAAKKGIDKTSTKTAGKAAAKDAAKVAVTKGVAKVAAKEAAKVAAVKEVAKAAGKTAAKDAAKTAVVKGVAKDVSPKPAPKEGAKGSPKPAAKEAAPKPAAAKEAAPKPAAAKEAAPKPAAAKEATPAAAAPPTEKKPEEAPK
jgi:hypothetical protein